MPTDIKVQKAGPKPGFVRIMLEENDNIPPTGQPFGLNGKTWVLKPGEEAEVPEAIVNILDDAVMSKPVKSQDGKGINGWRNQLRFPYRIIRSRD